MLRQTSKCRDSKNCFVFSQTPNTVLPTPRFQKVFWIYPDTKNNRFAYTHTPKIVLCSLPPENVFYLHSDFKNRFTFAYTPKTFFTTHRLQKTVLPLPTLQKPFWLHTDSKNRFDYTQIPKKRQNVLRLSFSYLQFIRFLYHLISRMIQVATEYERIREKYHEGKQTKEGQQLRRHNI